MNRAFFFVLFIEGFEKKRRRLTKFLGDNKNESLFVLSSRMTTVKTFEGYYLRFNFFFYVVFRPASTFVDFLNMFLHEPDSIKLLEDNPHVMPSKCLFMRLLLKESDSFLDF